MYNVRKIKEDLLWIGASDRRLSLFENVYPIPDGVSYNSYLLLDEKTVLLDTVDSSVKEQFCENLQYGLDGRELNYLVINHMEPDHCSEIATIMRLHPETQIVCNMQTKKMIEQFFNLGLSDDKYKLIKEGDVLDCGEHKLTFVFAPMVHWPEVMVTYDTTDKILFSADAFGTFGALNGNIFADEVNFAHDYLSEARRYYSNIVGKYGPQVQTLLKKAVALEIKMLCPLHGFIWRENINYLVEKYTKWAAYKAEDKAVVIAYGSIYGNTAGAAYVLASKLAEHGVKNIKMFDVSATHPSYIISEVFSASTLVLATATYNSGIFVNMENLLHDLTAHNVQNRQVAIIDNGTWAATAGRQVADMVTTWKNCTLIEPRISLKSAMKEEQASSFDVLAENIVNSLA